MRSVLKLSLRQITVVLFYLSLAAAGLFHDFVACLFSGVLCAVLLVYLLRQKEPVLQTGITFWSVCAIVFFYGASILWALDRGMAFVGFLKFLPVLLFFLLTIQVPESREQILALFPGAMAVMVVLSTLGSFLPALAEYLLVADRLAGFLQYPNTFALLLLVGQLLVLSKSNRKWWDWIILAVLLFGILYSGSRTVFALAVVANLALVFTVSSKRARILTLSAIAGGVVLILGAAVLTNSDVLNRFLRFSFLESTFAGRFLYWLDALPVILTHPFGLGYQGYYYIQQSVQTGIYTTMYTHNELLQLLLDIGWLPVILLGVAVGKTLSNKAIPLARKIILVTFLLHCCFDFDLQFVSVFFLLILFLDASGKTVKLRRTTGLSVALGSIGLVSVYMSVALWMPYLGQTTIARTLYPFNTTNNVQLLSQTENTVEAKILAEEILAQNDYVLIAHSMRARYAYSQGDFGAVIQAKNHILEQFPFQYPEYEEYCRWLITGIDLYEKNGDSASADYCRQALVAARDALSALSQRVSPLGKIIDDQPITTLPQEITDYINSISE